MVGGARDPYIWILEIFTEIMRPRKDRTVNLSGRLLLAQFRHVGHPVLNIEGAGGE